MDYFTPAELKLALRNLVINRGGNYYELYKTIECESNFNMMASGDSHKAFSIAQFHKDTFDRFCKGDYYNPISQLECMVQMFNKGLQNNWTCWSKLFNT